MAAIGIDFGTLNCYVAVYSEGKVTVIENEIEECALPSYVRLTKEERIVGTQAKEYAEKDPKNTIFGIKRILGRSFDDPVVQQFQEYVSFSISEDEKGIKIAENDYDKDKGFYLEEIAAILLRELKRRAETKLRESVTTAVITVPSSFNEAQRESIKFSATIAGFRAVELVNETTAVAVAYAHQLARHGQKASIDTLICHAGAGSFNVAVVEIGKRTVDVLLQAGISSLGGLDFDANISKHILEKYSLGKDRKTLAKVWAAAVDIKEKLSRSQSVTRSLNGKETIELNCEQYQKINYSVAQSLFYMLDWIRKSLDSYKNTTQHKTKICFVGGTARILKALPGFSKAVKERFDKLAPGISNEDTAAVIGAAIMAKQLYQKMKDEIVVNDTCLCIDGLELDVRQGEESTQQPASCGHMEWKQWAMTIPRLKAADRIEMAQRIDAHDKKDWEYANSQNAVNALIKFAISFSKVLDKGQKKKLCEEIRRDVEAGKIKNMDDVRKKFEELRNSVDLIHDLKKALDELQNSLTMRTTIDGNAVCKGKITSSVEQEFYTGSDCT